MSKQGAQRGEDREEMGEGEKPVKGQDVRFAHLARITRM